MTLQQKVNKLVKTHDLVLLNKTCNQYAVGFEAILDDCIELVDYGVQVSSPPDLELTKTEVEQAIKSAEKDCPVWDSLFN